MKCKYCGKKLSKVPLTDFYFCTTQIPRCSNYGIRVTKVRKCPKCGKTKPLTEFYKYNTGGNKVTYWCSECIEHYIKHTSVGAN